MTKRVLNELYWGQPPRSAHQIAKEFGVKHGSVVYRLHKFGIPVRPCHSGKVAPLKINVEKCKAMYASGMVLKEIGKVLGVHWENVRKYLKLAGVQMNPRHARVRTICKEPGCGQPVHKVWHAVLKGYYGTRCLAHRKRHYALLNRHRVRRIRNLTPDRWVPGKLKYPEIQVVTLPANVEIASRVSSSRCSRKACPFPVVRDGLCRGHLVDVRTDTSPFGSSAAVMIQQVHFAYLGE